MKEYIQKTRESLNNSTREFGNKLYSGLGDILTKDVKFAPTLATAGFFVTWMGINSYTAMKENAEGLVNMAYNGATYTERLSGSLMIGMEGLGSNIAGIMFGVGSAAILGLIGSKLDNIIEKTELKLKPKVN